MNNNRKRFGIKRRMAAVLAALLLVLFLIPATAENHTITKTAEIRLTDVDLPSNTVLVEGYLKSVFYGSKRTNARAATAGARLTGIDLLYYNSLMPLITKVANGESTSTEFKISVTDFAFTFEELGLAVNADSNTVLGEALSRLCSNASLAALLYDCPYDLYWYDKKAGCQINTGLDNHKINIGATAGDSTITVSGETLFRFSVAKEFAGDKDYTTSSAFADTVLHAKSKADAIVSANAGATDITKLTAYKNAICDLAEYDSNAASSSTMPYGNPWQLLYVFDENADTNVVCEGYAKAFQYLCDLSTFSSSGVKAISVTGFINLGSGGEAHMWNIVTLGGKKYLVDVTNCDTGKIGEPNLLFMAGYIGTTPLIGGGMQYNYTIIGGTSGYVFDTELTGLFGQEELTLSAESLQQEGSEQEQQGQQEQPTDPQITEQKLNLKIKDLKLTASGTKAIKVTWTKLSKKDQKKVGKFVIEISTDKKFKKDVITKTVSAKKNSVTIKKLKPGKKYYVRIRAIKEEGNIRYVTKWFKKNITLKKK